jgi:uncharacterized protein YjeT (DUF2065 family)
VGIVAGLFVMSGLLLAISPRAALRVAGQIRFIPFPTGPTDRDWMFARLSGVAVMVAGVAIVVLR